MRPLHLLAALALAGCAATTPQPDPVQAAEERERAEQADRQRSFEAGLRRSEALRQQIERQQQEERRERQEAEQEHARQIAARDAALARQRQQERDYANERAQRADWLMHGLTWTSEDAKAVARIWFTFAQLDRAARTPEVRSDAIRECLPAMNRDEEAAVLGAIFGRRAWADYYTEGSGRAFGPEARSLIVFANWDKCLKFAPQDLAKHGHLVRDIGFTEFLCIKLKTSTLTGNVVLEDEKHWKL